MFEAQQCRTSAKGGAHMHCVGIHASMLLIYAVPSFNESSVLLGFKHSNAIEIHNGIMFDFYVYPGLPHARSVYDSPP